MIAAKYRLFSAEPKLVSSRDNWKSTLEAIRAVIAPTYRLNGSNGQIRALERWNFRVRAVPLA